MRRSQPSRRAASRRSAAAFHPDRDRGNRRRPMATLKINGEQKTFDAADDTPLLWVLRDVLGMTGTKFGCGIAQCGACTVHLDGKAVRSCLLPVGSIGARSVTTIEGVGETPIGAKVQRAWLGLEVV